MDLQARLDVVETENATLRERVRLLEHALIGDYDVPIEWGLTASERRVFGALAGRRVASKDAILAALYRGFGRDEPEPKIIDVFICKLRKKLAPYGIRIETVWGTGYALAAPWQPSEAA